MYIKLTLQKGIDPLSQETIWLVLDEEYQIVEPNIQRYLTYLCGSRSPNTVESYGYDLKAWWAFRPQALRLGQRPTIRLRRL